jgi:lysophospholipase L1-like esterase
MLLERFDPGITESELDRMAVALKEAGATVLTGTHFNMPAAGVMPNELADMLRPRFEAVNERVRAVAARNDIVLIDFAALPWTADADLYSGDLQHLNRRGHAAAAEAIVERLAEHIGDADGSSGAV